MPFVNALTGASLMKANEPYDQERGPRPLMKTRVSSILVEVREILERQFHTRLGWKSHVRYPGKGPQGTHQDAQAHTKDCLPALHF
jgi:hypothetical protein